MRYFVGTEINENRAAHDGLTSLQLSERPDTLLRRYVQTLITPASNAAWSIPKRNNNIHNLAYMKLTITKKTYLY